MRILTLAVLMSAIINATVSNVLAADEAFVCPVTTMPNPPFEPPFSPYGTEYREFRQTSSLFYVGTPDLFMRFDNRWDAAYSRKMPFFSQGFNAKEESSPRLAVVARRLDAPDPRSCATRGSFRCEPAFPQSPEPCLKPRRCRYRLLDFSPGRRRWNR